MKSVNKLFKRKKSKIGTAAKILLPVAGVVGAKKLWDNKENLISDDVRSKVLEKTEAVQEKVQKFHDFVQNPSDESVDSVFVDETTEATTPTEAGEETDAINDEITEENVEPAEESNEDLNAEAGEIGKEN